MGDDPRKRKQAPDVQTTVRLSLLLFRIVDQIQCEAVCELLHVALGVGPPHLHEVGLDGVDVHLLHDSLLNYPHQFEADFIVFGFGRDLLALTADHAKPLLLLFHSERRQRWPAHPPPSRRWLGWSSYLCRQQPPGPFAFLHSSWRPPCPCPCWTSRVDIQRD
eukprot:418329-Prymnesium_polylepis.1